MKQLYIDSDNYLRSLKNDANERGYLTDFKNRNHPAFDVDSIEHICLEKDGISIYVELRIMPHRYTTAHQYIAFTLVNGNQDVLAKTPYDQPFDLDDINQLLRSVQNNYQKNHQPIRTDTKLFPSKNVR